MRKSLLDAVDAAQAYHIRMLPQGKHCWEVNGALSRVQRTLKSHRQLRMEAFGWDVNCCNVVLKI